MLPGSTSTSAAARRSDSEDGEHEPGTATGRSIGDRRGALDQQGRYQALPLGEVPGHAGIVDLLEFFKLLANPSKQFKVMPEISHASFQQKNHLMVYDVLASFLEQAEPVYRN